MPLTTIGPSGWGCESTPDGLRTLWFDRAGHSVNVLGAAAVEGLAEQVAAIRSDPTARVLVVRSRKAAGFAAGADLRELRAFPGREEALRFLARGVGVIRDLGSLPIPSVAVVHGACLGGGLELALGCRRLIVLPDARLGTPEVLFHLIPGWGGIPTLVRRVGLAAALDLLETGRVIDASEAARLGLVDVVFAAEALPVDASGWLETIARLGQRPSADVAADPGLLDAARRQALDSEPSMAAARLAILEIIEAESTGGPDAGREAALERLSGLIVSPEARDAIDAFFRGQGRSTASPG